MLPHPRRVRNVVHGVAMIVICSYCRRQRVNGEWHICLPPPAGAMVSHGICETCYASVIEPMLEEEDDDDR